MERAKSRSTDPLECVRNVIVKIIEKEMAKW